MSIFFKCSSVTAVVLSGVAVFLNCTTGPISGNQGIEYNQAVMKSNAVLQITDGYSKAPLDSVSVSFIGQTSATSDANGLVTVKDLSAGDYLLLIERNGYEPLYSTLSMVADSNSRAIPVLRQSVEMISMAKQGVTVKGRIFYVDSQGQKKVAEGVSLEIRLTAGSGYVSYKAPVRVVATNSTGYFTLSNLPEFTGFSIAMKPFTKGGVLYRGTSQNISSNRRAGDTIYSPVLTMVKSDEQEIIILHDNTKSLTASSELKITFSDKLNPASVSSDSIWVSNGSKKILTVLSVTENILGIKPFQGSWSPTVNYTLSIRAIRSVEEAQFNDGLNYTIPFQLSVKGALADVTGLNYRNDLNDSTSVDYATTTIRLFWNKLTNAQSYEIYVKSIDDSTWVYSTSVADTMHPSFYLPSNSFRNGGKLQVIVLGKNSESRSNFLTAKQGWLRDNVRPVYTGPATGTISGCNNASSTIADSAMYSIGYFREPMDTTLKPVLTAKEGGMVSTYYGDSTYTVSDLAWRWISQTSGQVKIRIPPQKNGAYDTVFVNLANLKDVSGNVIDSVTYGNYKTVKLVTRD